MLDDDDAARSLIPVLGPIDEVGGVGTRLLSVMPAAKELEVADEKMDDDVALGRILLVRGISLSSS